MKSHGREKRCKSPSCPINPTPDIAVLGYGAPAHTRADPFVTTVVGILWRRKGDGNKEEMVRNRTRRWRQINSLSIPWWTRSGNLLTVFQDRSRVLLSFFGGGRMQKKYCDIFYSSSIFSEIIFRFLISNFCNFLSRIGDWVNMLLYWIFHWNNSQYLEIRCSCFKWTLLRIESVNDERLDVGVTMTRTL